MNSEDGFKSDFRLGIAGLGLMGGSMSLALNGQCRRAGFDLNPNVALVAKQNNVVDEVYSELAEMVNHCDGIILAMPVLGILATIDKFSLLPAPARPRFLIDLGSTKVEICQAMARLGAGWEAIGGHPMCGKETGGLENASAALFRNARFALCAQPNTSGRARAFGRWLALAVQAIPLEIDPVEHDRQTALTSHVPYLVAVALTLAACPQLPPEDALVGPGFRDTTRLAGSNVTMMGDILATNRQNVLAGISRVQEELSKLKEMLAEPQSEQMFEHLRQTQKLRRDISSSFSFT